MTRFVLVHGAWLGGWCWRDVASLLRKAGHEVDAVTLDTRSGLRGHVRQVIDVLGDHNAHGTVLVGHSYGGTVITAVAGTTPACLRHLVFLDASTPQPGQSNNDLLEPTLVAELRRAARPDGDIQVIPPPPVDDWGLDEVLRRWVEPQLTPHPLHSLDDPVPAAGPAAANSPRAFLCTSPDSPIYRRLLHHARDQGWHCRALSGGHYAMLTAPQVVADALIALERSGRG
jgi:pimeloyl-ACP methyl ester carboxylesterase